MYEPELLALILETGENAWFLPGVPIPPSVRAVGSLAEAAAGAELVVVAVPSHVVRRVASDLAPHLAAGVPVLSAAKGIEEARFARVSEVLTEVLPAHRDRIAVLSGPTFALEVAQGRPTAAVVAAADPALARGLQQALAAPAFRLYTRSDVTGVELGGALKNVIAIAAGVSDGLDLGMNARAALLTRGLAEMTRLGVALGARPSTFAGLAGIGDLILTCTGALSRNRKLGLALAGGSTLAEWQAGTRSVAEGVLTTRAALALAGKVGVSAPITAEVAAVLFEEKPPREALTALLSREVRPEEEPDAPIGAPG